MRIASSILLLAASVTCFVLAATWRSNARYPVWNDSVIQYKVPDVPAEHDREITYLAPWSDKEYETVDGPTEYLGNHEWGWNECLDCFYDDARFENQSLWDVTDENAMASWNILHAPPHVLDAYRAGWLRCVEQIKDRLKSTTAGKLRRTLVVPQRPYIVSLAGFGTLFLALAGFVMAMKSARTVTEPTDPAGQTP